MVNGGAGNDTLIAGTGVDTLVGGADSDIFVLSSNSILGSVDLIVGTFNNGLADRISTLVKVDTVMTATAVSVGVVSTDMSITTLNALLNSSSGVSAVKFSGSLTLVSATAFTTTDNKSFIAIDADRSGAFSSIDYLIEITGSTLTSLSSATFI